MSSSTWSLRLYTYSQLRSRYAELALRFRDSKNPDKQDLYEELIEVNKELIRRESEVRFVHKPIGNYQSIPPLHCFKEYQMALVAMEEMNMTAQSSAYEEPEWIIKEKIELQYRIEMFKQKHSLK